jgi:hypothetical protein
MNKTLKVKVLLKNNELMVHEAINVTYPDGLISIDMGRHLIVYEWKNVTDLKVLPLNVNEKKGLVPINE